jgi:hypothetical protein
MLIYTFNFAVRFLIAFSNNKSLDWSQKMHLSAKSQSVAFDTPKQAYVDVKKRTEN